MTWTKIIIEDESTFPPPYKRLLFCNCTEPCSDAYALRPFDMLRTKYDLFAGVYLPDYRCKKYVDMKHLPLLRLLDDHKRDVTYRVQYWQLAPEPPVEINDTFEDTFRKVNENECD